MSEDDAIEKSTKFLINLMASIKYNPKNISNEHRNSYNKFRDKLLMEGFDCSIIQDKSLIIKVSRLPGFFESNYENLEIYKREYTIKEMHIKHRINSLNSLLD